MEFRSQPLSQLAHYPAVRLVGLGFFLGLIGIISARLVLLTTLGHDDAAAQAQENLYQQRRLTYPRGNISDRNGNVLATNKRCYAIRFSPYGQSDAVAGEALDRLAAILGSPSQEEREKILAARPRWTRHLIASGLGQSDVIPFIERPRDYPGVRIQEEYARVYEQPVDFALIVGFVGRIQPGQEAEFPRPRYLPDDMVGRSGIERQYQDRLAGSPGRERLQRDARGRSLAEPDVLEPSHPGEDLTLALDARIQTVAMDLLKGHKGSIVLMDVATGEVHAMASRPTFDATNPGAMELDGEPAGFVNLAMRGLYPPGSTLKVVSAMAALKEGVSPAERIDCRGSFLVDGWSRPFWCAHREGHGPMGMADSLKASCNVYYYTMAKRLGPRPLFEAGREFGLGRATGIDLPGEAGGQLSTMPNPASGETTNLYIGQGSMLATPLQVARMYAGLANGGVLPVPRVVIGGSAPATGGERLPMTEAQRAEINRGLYGAVNEQGGTAAKAGIPRAWGVCGKTGTAENATGGVDAWFAGFFPQENPRFAFAVHVEEADGHGGDVAGPIARELIRAVLAPTDQKSVAALP